jgi:4a-hydroxytetrahydrobiopterin dehydratase
MKAPTRAELIAGRCRPVGAQARMNDAELDAPLALLPGWSIVDGAIERSFGFADFHRTMAFVNALVWIAHHEDHHPDLQVGYGRCVVRWRTHSAGGITINDFICATKVAALLPDPAG